MLLCIRRWSYWYATCWFSWTIVLECLSSLKLVMNPKKRFQKACWSVPSLIACVFAFSTHVLGHVSPPDWPAFHLSETHRFALARVHVIYKFAIISFNFHNFIFFLNFYFISHADLPKIISQRIFVQIMWDFLHNVPHDL